MEIIDDQQQTSFSNQKNILYVAIGIFSYLVIASINYILTSVITDIGIISEFDHRSSFYLKFLLIILSTIFMTNFLVNRLGSVSTEKQAKSILKSTIILYILIQGIQFLYVYYRYDLIAGLAEKTGGFFF